MADYWRPLGRRRCECYHYASSIEKAQLETGGMLLHHCSWSRPEAMSSPSHMRNHGPKMGVTKPWWQTFRGTCLKPGIEVFFCCPCRYCDCLGYGTESFLGPKDHCRPWNLAFVWCFLSVCTWQPHSFIQQTCNEHLPLLHLPGILSTTIITDTGHSLCNRHYYKNFSHKS